MSLSQVIRPLKLSHKNGPSFIGLLASLGSVHWGFIARISKGRTIKEFLITTIFIPTIASVIWFYILQIRLLI
jgi:hypothetical protein